MKVYPETKIYIISPGNMHSGGPELVHQLASQLLKMNFNVFMFYLPANPNFNPNDPVDPFYRKYHIPYAKKIETSDKNIVIVPESSSLNLYVLPGVRRIMWWMSVDNYVNNLCNILKKFKMNPLQSTMPKFFYFDKNDRDIEHWVQSDYAEIFIKKNGIVDEQIHRVRDYLNEAFLIRAKKIDLSKKENIVAYNPVKGFEFTQKLLKFAPEINWQPIRDMTPDQVQDLLSRAKVYIDFGNHPGRDRIPREAAISGCCVITGKRGAAANQNDIAIDDSFKFEDTDQNLEKIVERIKEIFKDFKKNFDTHKKYREQILLEPSDFIRDVKAAFNFTEPVDFPTPIAVLPKFSGELVDLVRTLSTNKSFSIKFIVDDKIAWRKGVKVKSEIIKTYNCNNYLAFGNIFIPFINSQEAAFLFREKRIDKFATVRSAAEDSKAMIKNFGVNENDLLIFNKR